MELVDSPSVERTITTRLLDLAATSLQSTSSPPDHSTALIGVPSLSISPSPLRDLHISHSYSHSLRIQSSSADRQHTPRHPAAEPPPEQSSEGKGRGCPSFRDTSTQSRRSTHPIQCRRHHPGTLTRRHTTRIPLMLGRGSSSPQSSALLALHALLTSDRQVWLPSHSHPLPR